MLVPTMTPEEIHAELFKDAAWLQDEINLKLIQQYGKHVKRTTRFPDIRPYVRESKKTNIIYYIILFSYRRSEWDRPHWMVYTKYTHETGRTLIYLESKQGMGIRIYTSHFIQRYLERQAALAKEYQNFANVDAELFFILRNREVHEMTFIADLIKNNPNDPFLKKHAEKIEHSRFWQDPDYDRYAVACSTGVCLCERNKKNPLISIYDTFLNVKLLKPDQFIDYIMAYSHILLNEMTNVYPRQKLVWGKEWNELVDKVQNDDSKDGDPISEFTAKMDEFEERYPLYDLL